MFQIKRSMHFGINLRHCKIAELQVFLFHTTSLPTERLFSGIWKIDYIKV